MWFLLAIAAAQTVESDAQLRLTALDLPYQAVGAPWAPSMAQSLDTAYALDRLAVLGTREAMEALSGGEPGLLYGLGFPLLAGVNMGLSLSTSAWMHEEWHRAVLSNQQVSSRNGWYVPSTWSGGLIPVDSVTDADLARLKRDTPADTVRLMIAGQESQHTLSARIGDELFLHGGTGSHLGPLYRSETWMGMTMQFEALSTLFYTVVCANADSDDVTDEQNRTHRTVLSRDFTGLDCTAWMYDMRRPGEPYADRGPHPYGAGIDRYRSSEDLSPGERQALKDQVLLGLLNAVNPHLYFVDGFRIGDGSDRWIASLGQQGSPFGHAVDLRLGLKRGDFSGVARVRSHFWRKGWLPELEASVYDIALTDDGALQLDLGANLWLQPKDLRWDADGPRPGGRLVTGLSWRASPGTDWFAQLEGKSEGWVPGNVALGPTVSVRSGVVLHAHLKGR